MKMEKHFISMTMGKRCVAMRFDVKEDFKSPFVMENTFPPVSGVLLVLFEVHQRFPYPAKINVSPIQPALYTWALKLFSLAILRVTSDVNAVCCWDISTVITV